jgi:hypothetical protein
MQRKTPAWVLLLSYMQVSIPPRGVAVAADRCVAVAEARSVGDLGEKGKRREKKREPRGREKQEREPRAHRDGEILWSRPEFLHIQKILWYN